MYRYMPFIPCEKLWLMGLYPIPNRLGSQCAAPFVIYIETRLHLCLFICLAREPPSKEFVGWIFPQISPV